ncbi:MAG: glycosyltransferase family 9 protein, partial [Flavobacterium sp.]|nr:glycosyltransferase family 9 protein [Flavobacterium sp.]
MKVLVIQHKMIGDVLASTVICEVLKKEHPDWKIHYLIEKNTLPVVENNPYIDKIVLFDPQANKGLFRLIQFGKQLKKEKYALVIDVYGKWQSIIPAYFSGAKTIIGHYKWYTTFFYTKTVVPDTECNGTANAYRLLLASTALNKKVELVYPAIHLSESELNLAKTKMSVFSSNKPIFMISVLGSGKNKSLPPSYMANVLDYIAENKEAQILFNYIPKQRKEVEHLYHLCNEKTKSQIHLDFYADGLRDFLGILAQCDALIGNEGGATNMAKALSIPTFTIYAPWINKTSWNIMEETGLHDVVHLSDYYPDLYQNKHPKNFKYKALEWYEKFQPGLFKEKLIAFLKRIDN